MLRAQILDFDGVVLDTELALIAAYGDVHRAHDITFLPAELELATGQATFDFDPWRGFPGTANLAEFDRQRREASEARFLHLPPMPGIVSLVLEARRRGLRLGMSSNSLRPHVEHHLAPLGLIRSFDGLAVRGEVLPPKPTPDLYRHVVHRLNASAAEAISFEDSAIDVQSARAASVFVVALPTAATAAHDFSVANRIVLSLAEIDLDALGQMLPEP